MSDEGSNKDFVPFEAIREYVKLNVPIVPLKEDGFPNTYDLYTPVELAQIGSNLSEFETQHIFKDPVKRGGLKPVNLLLRQAPLEFWTDEKIHRQKWHGIAALAGPSVIPADSDPNKIRLFILVDADDPRAITIVRRVIEKRGYLTDKRTIVQNSPGDNKGLHCEFYIAVDPNNLEELDLWRRRFLRQIHCKAGGKVEIKTWFSGQITLDPSRYRKDRTRFYKNTSGYKGVVEDDPIIYDLLISELKNGDCLRITPEEASKLEDSEAEDDTTSSNGAASYPDEDRELNDPSDARVAKAIEILLGRDVDENGESQFNSIYIPGSRNQVILALGAHLFHNKIRLEFSKEIIKRMCESSDYKDTKKPLETLGDTYDKGYKNQKIRGKSGLIDLFNIADKKGENDVRARARLSKLNHAFGFNNKTSKNSDNFKKFTQINEADLIADLARKKISFMFINKIKQPCAIVERDGVIQLMVMSDKDGDFADELRRLWRDENEAKGFSLKTTLPEDRITQARMSLISDAKRLPIETIRTPIRVAWEKKDEIARYDLADPQRRQIRIWGDENGKGVEIIDSTCVLNEIKEFRDSNYLKAKTPVFFQRFSQTAQVLPSETFRPNILDIFFKTLTNVLGLRTSNSYKRSVKHWETEGSLEDDEKLHIAKVGLINMLVPEIPHNFENAFGPTRVNKTTFFKYKKWCIDPTENDSILPGKLKDIEKILAQNYYVVFDNFFDLPQWLSDLLSAAVTGSGFDVRELFTTQKFLHLKIKLCIAISSVPRIFKNQDAIARLVSYEFMPYENEKGYRTESALDEEFERIRPEIISCMYHTLSKAVNIKRRIADKYDLGGMADVLEWSEAISQALGYDPELYLKRYNRLRQIQERQAASFDHLTVYFRRIFYDNFVKPESDFSNGHFSSIEEEIRKRGYVTFNYKRLNEILEGFAEEEGYNIKTSNKLWPQDSSQLANRVREVGLIIAKNYGFLVEVQKTRMGNEYIIGNKDAVERYLQTEEDSSDDSFVKNTIDLCAKILQEKDDLILPYDMMVQLASLQNPGIHTRLNGNYKLEKNLLLHKIVDGLKDHPLIEEVENQRQRSFKYKKEKQADNPNSEDNLNSEDESKAQESKDASNEGASSKSVTNSHNNLIVNPAQIAVRRSFSIFNFESFRSKKNETLKVGNGKEGRSSQFARDCREESSIASDKQQVSVQVKPVASSPFYDLVPQFKKFAAFDTEWHREDLESNKASGKAGMIYCFCLVDNQGQETKIHLNDFNGHNGKFMSAVLDAIQKYDVISGYAILAKKEDWMRYGINGDIEQIRSNCDKVELLDRFNLIKENVRFLDLHSIFTCGNVKSFLDAAENVKYRGEKLNDVATAYLKEGKFENVKGSDAEFLDPRVQLDYCMQDAKLCLKLSQKDNYRLLTILFNISKEIGSDHDFFLTSNYAQPTAWWRDTLKPRGYEKVSGDFARWQQEHITFTKKGKKKGVHYTGGKVFDPIPGLHKDVITYDVSSMYPTMGIVHNISSETINCECCKGDPSARISDAVMKRINDDLVADGYQARPWHYWICNKRRGIFSTIMEELYKKKTEYKKLGLVLEEKAVKLFANSGYGTFGYHNFEFYDVRVTELITGFARHTLIGLTELLQENNIEVLYGDTDSLFVKGNTATVDIASLAKQKFQVDFSKDKTWILIALTENKKAYFGILDNGKLSYKILPGLKSNYPLYCQETVSQLTSKETLELFLDNGTDARQAALQHVIENVTSAFHTLGDNLLIRDMEYVKENLCYSEEASAALYTYGGNCWQTYLFNEKLEDHDNDETLAKINSSGKTVYSYWKITDSKKSATMHPERYTLSALAYKEDLWTCVELILRVYGMAEDNLSRVKNRLVYDQTEIE